MEEKINLTDGEKRIVNEYFRVTGVNQLSIHEIRYLINNNTKVKHKRRSLWE